MNFLLGQSKRLGSAICVAILATNFCGLARAGDDFLRQCPLKKGDQLASVKGFYQISVEPTELEKPSLGGASFVYHFKEYGVFVYFDEKKRVQNLRFEHPWSGMIEGIAVGDGKVQVASVHGEPVKKFQASPDVEVLESRMKRKQVIVETLPDPASKEQVRRAFAAIEVINALPYTYSHSWVYNNKDGSMVRYDIGSVTNAVQTIMTERGTDPLNDKLPAPTTALKSITQEAIRDFFQRGDQLYTKGKLDAYLAQYADNYAIQINGKLIADGKRVRKLDVFQILVQDTPRLSETVVHAMAIADNGQTAVAKVTATERFRKQVGDIRNVSEVLRPILHNFAIIDEESISLALVDGMLKIVRTDIQHRDKSENAGK